MERGEAIGSTTVKGHRNRKSPVKILHFDDLCPMSVGLGLALNCFCGGEPHMAAVKHAGAVGLTLSRRTRKSSEHRIECCWRGEPGNAHVATRGHSVLANGWFRLLRPQCGSFEN